MSVHGPRPISIAIAALGGQGGGVLANWIVDLGRHNGYLVQSTSVPGVAQRTGTTIYSIEMIAEAETGGATPVLALYPVPGDVDIVLAAELVEAGRAIQMGFVTPELTTLISSAHRVYSMEERMALGDGIRDQAPTLEAAGKAARRFICFDMEAVASQSGCVISSVLLGALAGSGALPFDRGAYEEAIRRSGKTIKANLDGFAAGFDAALAPQEEATAPVAAPLIKTEGLDPAVARLTETIRNDYPAVCRDVIAEGVRRMLDYQDPAYAELYLDRLADIHALESLSGGRESDYALTRETARYLALRMAYEDTFRVADLKTRGSRFERFRAEVNATPEQPVYVTEFMHPRVEEICDTLPRIIGQWVMGSTALRGLVRRLFSKPRYFHTTKLTGFMPLYVLAWLKRWRRTTYRFAREQREIGDG